MASERLISKKDMMDHTVGSGWNKTKKRSSKRDRYTIIASLSSLFIFAVLTFVLGISMTARFALVFLFVPVFVYLQFKEKRFTCSPEMLMNEAPSVIGMMSVTLSAGGSFDSAVRDVADHGPKNISQMFKKIILSADCRETADIKAAVLDMVSSLPRELSSFRRAIHIVVTAFESSDEKESAAMMKDAENIVLIGLKEIGSSYSAKLNSPCMLIFGLGIMVPMILISILPMLSMSGSFAVKCIDSNVVTLIVLVVIPAVVGCIVLSMRGKNPFFKLEGNSKDIRYLLPMMIAVPIYFMCERYGLSMNQCLLYSLVAGGFASAICMYPAVSSEKKRCKSEEMLKDALFELGNRLSMGENFDTALVRALTSRKDCANVADSVEKELVICRGDIISAIEAVIGPISKLMSGFYCDVYRASLRDIRDAGRLASSIAHQLQDQNSARKDIENKLKSMMDMMTGTSALFAPLILGMSVVMLGPISDITGTSFFDNLELTLMVYLVELAALISVLSSNLMCKGRLLDVMHRFCLMMPLALVIFTICSSLSI